LSSTRSCPAWCSSRPGQTAARRVETFAEELCFGVECFPRLRALAEGSLQLAAHEFDRNGYLNRLEIDGRLDGLRRPSRDPDAAHRTWTTPVVDDDIAARWRSLGQLPPNTIGRHVHDVYVLRGFAFPGTPGSAPPLLASTSGGTSSPTTAPSRPSSKYSG
jgi:hypothetical protein